MKCLLACQSSDFLPELPQNREIPRKNPGQIEKSVISVNNGYALRICNIKMSPGIDIRERIC
jgi:hypothetical protein